MDRYRFIEQVGAGAMGDVWRAERLEGQGSVAIKVMQAESATKPVVVARFKSEAMAASRLDHPNAVQVLDFGEGDDGLLFIVMEYLRGQTLDVVLKRVSRLSEQRALSITVQVLDALAAAHLNNIIHRDLKPANVMLVKDRSGEERVKVLDFGIAKFLDPVHPDDPTGMMTLTRAGMVVGTPSYMSPEQASGQRIDARADVYSAGVTLYHMLTGEKPFRSATLMGLLQQVMENEAPRVSTRLSTVDPRVETIVATAMRKRPLDRFPSARAMRDAIQAVIDAGDRTLHSVSAHGRTLEDSASTPAYAGPIGGPRAIEVHSVERARTATMQSFGGQTIGSSTATFAPPPTDQSVNRLILMGFAIILAIVFGVMMTFRAMAPGVTVDELARRVEMNAWGAAESYALEHYEVFSKRPEAGPLIRRAMAGRRSSSAHTWKNMDVAYDPDVRIEPGEWQGEARFAGREERVPFTFVIEAVDGHAVEGYCDWPGIGVRVRVEGFRDGNHLVMWDAAFLIESGRAPVTYTLYDKKSLFVMGDRMVGYDGPYRATIEARRAGM